jgi:hypothetical protein
MKNKYVKRGADLLGWKKKEESSVK